MPLLPTTATIVNCPLCGQYVDGNISGEPDKITLIKNNPPWHWLNSLPSGLLLSRERVFGSKLRCQRERAHFIALLTLLAFASPLSITFFHDNFISITMAPRFSTVGLTIQLKGFRKSTVQHVSVTRSEKFC